MSTVVAPGSSIEIRSTWTDRAWSICWQSDFALWSPTATPQRPGAAFPYRHTLEEDALGAERSRQKIYDSPYPSRAPQVIVREQPEG
ncbi:hypothetical protein [Rhodanobacter soli]